MRSRKITLNFPHRLWDALEKHAVEVGYENARQMLQWMPVYSLTVGAPHYATAPIAQMDRNAQDMIIEQVVCAYERGEFGHQSYFGKVLQEVVEQLRVPVAPDVLAKILAAAFTRRPRKEREGELPL